jgi:hypothetical protein
VTNYVRNPTWSDGAGGATPITAAKLNNIENGIFDAHFAPCARVTHNANQSIANSTPTVLAFNTERYDTVPLHDTSTNNERLTCKTAGKYQITASIEWSPNATGGRQIYIRLNGTTQITPTHQVTATAAGTMGQTATTLYDLAVNDYVDVVVTQNSGGALNVTTNPNYSPEFMMARVG